MSRDDASPSPEDRKIVDHDEWGDPIYEGDVVIDWSVDPPVIYIARQGGPQEEGES